MRAMLLSVVISLEPLDRAAYSTSARQVQRWLKDSLEASAPALFARLHPSKQTNDPRAYTVSRVMPSQSGFPAWVRLTSMDGDLSRHLCLWLRTLEADPRIVLDPERDRAAVEVLSVDWGTSPYTPFQVAARDPASWAGHTTYAALKQCAWALPADPASETLVRLQFHSPTTFRQQGDSGSKRNLARPEPRHVFQNSLRKWNEFAPDPLSLMMRPVLERFVRVQTCNLESAFVPFAGGNRGKALGFTGDVDFRLARCEDLSAELQSDWQGYANALRLLAAFSFFSGTGWRTTQGLGQTLPLESGVL